jgi:hypothetical protein
VQADEPKFEGVPASLDADRDVGPPKTVDRHKRPSALGPTWRAAKLGFWCASYVIGPFAFLFFAAGLAITAFGLGSGRGFALSLFVPRAIGFYLIMTLWFAIFAAVLGFVIGAVRWLRWTPDSNGWWAQADKPIRLRRRRHGVDDAPVTPNLNPVTPASPYAAPSTALDAPSKSADVLGDHSVPPEQTSKRRLRTHLLQIAGLLLLLVLFVSFAVGVYAGRVVDRRLNSAIAAADKDDPYWRLQDLIDNRIPVPDKENASVILDQVLALIPDSWPAGPRPRPGTPNPPKDNASEANDRMAATADNVRLDEATAQTIRDELTQRADAVRIARTVAD